MTTSSTYHGEIDHFIVFSVDIVGSTAFKTSPAGSKISRENGIHAWAIVTDRIFDTLRKKLEHLSAQGWPRGSGTQLPVPRFWKTRGDELLLVCPVQSCIEVARLVSNFLIVVDNERNELKKSRGGEASAQAETDLEQFDTSMISLKSAIWIARFPFENVAKIESEDQDDRNFQYFSHVRARLRQNPSDCDLNGPEIDAGFRLSALATEEQTPISVDLAWVLTFAQHGSDFNHHIRYIRRVELKGVRYGAVYPHIVLLTDNDSPKSRLQRTTIEYEDEILGRSRDVAKMKGFCVSWMLEHDFAPMRFNDEMLPGKIEDHQRIQLGRLWDQQHAAIEEFKRLQAAQQEISDRADDGYAEPEPQMMLVASSQTAVRGGPRRRSDTQASAQAIPTSTTTTFANQRSFSQHLPGRSIRSPAVPNPRGPKPPKSPR